nr:hypothetical transcript [Hymenolepis microstoma]
MQTTKTNKSNKAFNYPHSSPNRDFDNPQGPTDVRCNRCTRCILNPLRDQSENTTHNIQRRTAITPPPLTSITICQAKQAQNAKTRR